VWQRRSMRSQRRAATWAASRRRRRLALRLAAVERVGGRGGALRRRPLSRSSRDAVPPPVGRRRRATRPRGEEVVLVGEVLEALQRADGRRHRAFEEVPGDVELLDGGQAGDAPGKRALEVVAADVEHRHLPEQPDLRRDASGELVVDEHDFVERLGHPPDGRRDATPEAVVREHDDGRRRAPEVGRDGAREAVGVEEDGVERAVEQLGRDGALEVVEPEVEVPERRQREHHLREAADEAVVADVELVEEPEVGEGVGEHAAEAVGVEVEQREVGEALGERRRDIPGDVGVVEVEPGDDADAAVGGVRRAEHAVVAAHVGAGPVGGEVRRVGEDGRAPPRLERDVRRAEAGVRERPRRRRVHGGGLRRGRRRRRERQEQREERRAPGHCLARARRRAAAEMFFTRLDDSPMFRKQIQSLEEGSELLRERCLRFHKGCRKYTEGLGEAYDGDIAFASSLEAFGGGHNDPISVAFGGPVMTKFTIALREIGTYKEVLRSQVENMLNDKLLQFVDIDLHDVKDARKRFDKASLLYDQVT
jgi:hypothetical protein